jgi:tetratricopeptide (TPR) repeat protein
VKRILLAATVLIAGMAGVFIYTSITQDREYARLVAAGDQALGNDQTFPAIEAFSGAIALKPDVMLAYLKRGETYRYRGEPQAALRDLLVATRLDPASTRPLEQLADVYGLLGQHEEAAARYERYVEIDDQNPMVLYKLALARYYVGRPDLAVPSLRAAIALDDTLADVYYLLALCLRDLDQADNALEALERAVSLEPGFMEARQALVNVYRAMGRTEDEIGQLEALAVLDPARAERDVTLGLAHARAGDTDLAITALGRASEDHPGQPLVYAALGLVWLNIAETRHDRVALSKAIEALQSIPSTTASSAALTLLGRALELADNVEGAARAYQQATQRFPVDPLAFMRLAGIAERQGDAARARSLLIRYRALTGDTISLEEQVASAVRLADLSLRLQEPGAAAEWFQRAAALAPPDAGLLGRLAVARWASGDLEGARAAVAQGLEQHPLDASLLALQHQLQ